MSFISEICICNFEMAASYKNFHYFRPVKDMPDLVFNDEDPPLVAPSSSSTPTFSQPRSDGGAWHDVSSRPQGYNLDQSDHSNHDWHYGEVHQMMKEILSEGIKELLKHEKLEHKAQSLKSQLYAIQRVLCISQAKILNFFEMEVDQLHGRNDVSLFRRGLRRIFLPTDHPDAKNLDVLHTFPIVWDISFWPHYSPLTDDYHCTAPSCAHVSASLGGAWQHVSVSHTYHEAVCPFCSDSVPEGILHHHLIGYTNPEYLQHHILLVHRLPSEIQTPIFPILS